MNPSALLRAMRPHQWAKNVFVLAPLVFALGDQRVEHQLRTEDVVRTLIAILAFCFASSAIYLVNDVLDVEGDRAHPEKRKRPIAAGELSIPAALVAAGALAASSLGAGVWMDHGLGVMFTTVLGYVALNLAYSVRLKHVVLLDAFCIAAGFLLRIRAGGAAANAEVSHWLFLCTLFLSLFLALNKRRAEIMLLGDERELHRASLKEYSVGFLDQMVGMLAACAIVAYTMYTVDEDTLAKFGSDSRLVWSVPFVVFGIGRYMVIVQSGRGGGNPTRILLGGDPWFLANILAWGAAVGWALFG